MCVEGGEGEEEGAGILRLYLRVFSDPREPPPSHHLLGRFRPLEEGALVEIDQVPVDIKSNQISALLVVGFGAWC